MLSNKKSLKSLLLIFTFLLSITVVSTVMAMEGSVYDSMRNRIISTYSVAGEIDFTIYIEVRDSSGNLIDPANLPNLNDNPDVVAQSTDGEISLSYNETAAVAYISYTDPTGGHTVAVIDLSTGSGGGGDTEPPTVPTGLTATAVSSSQINLTWNQSTDNVGVAGYKVFMGNNYLKSVTTTSTSVYNLSPDHRYCFSVSAYDEAGNESAQSSQACATTQGQGGGGGGDIDLQPRLFWGSTIIYKGGTNTFEYKIRNNGSDPSGTYTIKIYLSEDTTISENDWLLKTITASSLAGGTETASQYVTVTNPTNVITHHDYYYIMMVDPDNQITETDENNNKKSFWGTVP